MDKGLIFVIIGFVLFFSVPIALMSGRKKVLRLSGKCIFSFSRDNKIRTVLIYVFSLLLLCLVSVKNFSLLIKLIFEFCGIFGAYIGGKENVYNAVAGIYENGLICADGFFPFDEILTLPVENLSEDEKKSYSKDSLLIATESKGNVEIHFEDESVCEKAKSVLFELCPRLNSCE